MNADAIINNELFTQDTSQRLKIAFNTAVPFRHLVIDDFLDPAFAQSLDGRFPSLSRMKTHYAGLNEKKAEDNDFVKQDPAFTLLHNALSSPDFEGWLADITGITPLGTVDDRLGYGLHQGGDGSFLDIHIDYNIHPITKLQRKLNFLLFLNHGWQEEWGGLLQLWDARTEKTGHAIPPLFNRVVIFECSQISFHGCSKLHVPPGITRKSIYQYY